MQAPRDIAPRLVNRIDQAKAAVCLSCFPVACFGYIDPGTGAYIVQLLVVLFGAVVFYVTRPVQWLLGIIRKLRRSKDR